MSDLRRIIHAERKVDLVDDLLQEALSELHDYAATQSRELATQRDDLEKMKGAIISSQESLAQYEREISDVVAAIDRHRGAP